MDWIGLDWVECLKNLDGLDWIGLRRMDDVIVRPIDGARKKASLFRLLNITRKLV